MSDIYEARHRNVEALVKAAWSLTEPEHRHRLRCVEESSPWDFDATEGDPSANTFTVTATLPLVSVACMTDRGLAGE